MATFLYRHFDITVSIWQLSSTVTSTSQWVDGNFPLPSLYRHSEYMATFLYRHSIGTVSIWQLSSTVTSSAQWVYGNFPLPSLHRHSEYMATFLYRHFHGTVLWYSSFVLHVSNITQPPTLERKSVWNPLPASVRNIPTLWEFKTQFKLSSLERPFHKPRPTIAVRVGGAYVYVSKSGWIANVTAKRFCSAKRLPPYKINPLEIAAAAADVVVVADVLL